MIQINIGTLCTNCGSMTSELEGAYPSSADSILKLGWQSYNKIGPDLDIVVDGLLCPDCQVKGGE